MAEVITCVSCQRKLQVPENLLGQDVQCPTCGATFLAQVGGAPPPPSANAEPRRSESRELTRTSRRERDYDDDDYEREHRRVKKRRRHDYEPHRGGMILAFGIIGFFFMPFVFGPIAWIMGNNDLEAMRTGRMDPEGEGQTNAGRICGMIATILAIASLVIGLLLVCLWFVCAIGMFGAAAGSRPPSRKGGF